MLNISLNFSVSSLDSVVSHASATNPEISIRVPSKKTHTLTSVKIDKHNKRWEVLKHFFIICTQFHISWWICFCLLIIKTMIFCHVSSCKMKNKVFFSHRNFPCYAVVSFNQYFCPPAWIMTTTWRCWERSDLESFKPGEGPRIIS